MYQVVTDGPDGPMYYVKVGHATGVRWSLRGAEGVKMAQAMAETVAAELRRREDVQGRVWVSQVRGAVSAEKPKRRKKREPVALLQRDVNCGPPPDGYSGRTVSKYAELHQAVDQQQMSNGGLLRWSRYLYATVDQARRARASLSTRSRHNVVPFDVVTKTVAAERGGWLYVAKVPKEADHAA